MSFDRAAAYYDQTRRLPADTAERVDEIDRARAEASLKRAEMRLTDASRDAGVPRDTDASREVDRPRAQRSQERAKNRIAIAKG